MSDDEQPKCLVEMSYDREDFMRFLSFYHVSVRKEPLKQMGILAATVLIGAAVSWIIDNWLYLALFAVLGVLLVAASRYSQNRNDILFADRNMKGQPVLYGFYGDHMSIRRSGQDRVVVRYRDIYTVFELEDVYYIMTTADTVAIFPKSRSPEEMPELIAGMDRVKTEWLETHAS